MTPDRSRHIPAIASALLALITFAVTLGGTYIYDDDPILFQDQRISHPDQWGQFWTQTYNGNVDRLYRPLVSTSYAIEWWLHGDRPWVFHLINWLLHAAVSAMVAEFSMRLFGMRTAFIAGLLYAAHPIHVEAVANIVGRAELMCALGMLGASLLFFGPLTPRRAIAIAGCFIFAVLSKEQGMLLPLLLLILWPSRQKLAPSGDTRSGILWLVLLLSWGLAGYIIWREYTIRFWWDRNFLDWTINPMVNSRWNPFGGSVGRDRILMPLALLGRYTALLVAPIKLSPDYGGLVIGSSVRLTDPHLWIGIGTILTWFIIVATAWRTRHYAVVFAAVALALTYGMVGNIVALIGINFSERLMYLPSIFFVQLIAVGLARLPRPAWITITCVAIVLGFARSVTYAHRWNDAIDFYRTSLNEQPKSIRLYMLLAAQLERAGRYDEAAQVADAGSQLLPQYWDIWTWHGRIAMDRMQFDQAMQDFNRAMTLQPNPGIEALYGELDKRRAAATQPHQPGSDASNR